MAFEMDNLTESGVDDVRDRGNGAGKGKAQMQPAGESGEDPLGEDRQGLLTHLREAAGDATLRSASTVRP
ncbi:hypothetical protein E4U09_001677 [Claviceps aff. purpurea]|uniref:Uncharacterized protein n=1 Tax=Claviceps aff. purpurea TaxID=1967640 RepID=A0A9P7U246_9HYPO|nr:hypothetical protein E4U09_001677 [Claviceps aff. purpurea]